MRTFFSATLPFVLLAAVTASPVLAQDVASSTGSVSDISQRVKVGQVVAVRDASGRTTSGILASISSDSLVVLRKRARFFRR